MLFFYGFKKKRLITLSFIFGIWVLILHMHYPHSPHLVPPNVLTGKILSFPSGVGKKRFIIKTKEYGQGVIEADSLSHDFLPGAFIQVLGSIKPLYPPTNPGQFDYGKYLESQNIGWLYSADTIIGLQQANLYWRFIHRFRNVLQTSLRETIAPEALPVIEAALLGSRSMLTPETRESFANSGMFHLLAISGLHVGVIALVLIQLFLFFRVPRKGALCLAGILLLIYIPVSGSSISVIRSVIMFWCIIISTLSERRQFTMNNLAVTCTLCLLAMPYQILSLGFQLSFTATFFLLYYSETFSQILQNLPIRSIVVKSMVSTLLVGVLLFMATFPFLAAHIHQISPLAIIGNILTIFLTSFMVLTGVLSILFHVVHYPGVWMGETCSIFADALLYSVRTLSGVSWSHIFQQELSWPIICVILATLIISPFAFQSHKFRLVILSMILVVSFFFGLSGVKRTIYNPVEITFLDVGQGDALLCRLPGNTNILIDAGNGKPNTGSGKYTILPYLKYCGINRLDLVIVTHGDLDHYGGLHYLAGRVNIDKVIYPGNQTPTERWRGTMQKLKQHQVPVEIINCNDTLFRSDEVSLVVLSPCYDGQFDGRNNNSVVMKLLLHRKTLLLTGDIEREAEAWLISHYKMDVDILKVSHHGSAGASSNQFLAYFKPEIALISAGRNNRFKMPHEETLRRLENHKIITLSTQQFGAIQFTSDRFRDSWKVFLRSHDIGSLVPEK
ncbi:MAG: DNA internalization-related competence protein ComEC/Rec2 [Fibrobacteria bacterium]|nr:DNA internalization-related competence protein ComEC/Rec2 [Fibrobacteria bacterium]